MDWMELIGKVGFPIATVIYLLWQSKKDKEQMNEQSRKDKEKMNDRMDHLDNFIKTDLKAITEESSKVIATNNEILIKNTIALEKCTIEIAKKQNVA